MDRGLCGLPAAEESSTQVIIPGTLTQNHRRGGERSQGGGVPWLLPDPISMMKTKTPREKGTTQVALILMALLGTMPPGPPPRVVPAQI